MGRGNQSLFAAPGSHYQDGRHAHIWFNPLKIFIWNKRTDFYETLYVALGTVANKDCSNDDPGLTLTYFMTRSNLVVCV